MAGATVPSLLLRPVLRPSLAQVHPFHLSQPRRDPHRSTIRCCTAPPHVPKPNPGARSNATDIPKLGSPVSPTPRRLLGRIGEDLRVDAVVMEIASIALPAVLALAADPLTSLVDTAFVGHVGSVELAAVGVSISVFNLIAKLFNVPLLNITTSFVAEEQALDGCIKDSNQNITYSESELLPQKPLIRGATQGKKYLPAVSSSLVLAAGIGITEAVALFLGSGTLVDIMGIVVDSPMRMPAQQFLALRALGAPAIVTALAAQGTFRGFLDTKTPLYAVGIGNLLNAILDPILMFSFGLGIDGAAIATVIADYLIAFILLWKLNKDIVLIPSDINGEKVVQYLKSGALLIGRTIAVVGTTTLATSLAARRGPIPMAGHEICLQVWLAVSLLNDALALAGQALLASEYTKGNYVQARLIIYRILQIGLITGIFLAIILFIGFGSFCSLFTTDVAVLEIARSGILFVTASQPINAIAFVLDGLYYGVSDFAYAAYSMVHLSCITRIIYFCICSFFLLTRLISWQRMRYSSLFIAPTHYNSVVRTCWSLGRIICFHDVTSSSWIMEARQQKWTMASHMV